MYAILLTTLGNEVDHDLILTPLVVPVNVESLTVIPVTSSSFGYRPRLPMLIPWPGPQWTLVMLMSLLPGPKEMQSSPVPITEFLMLIPVDLEMCMPSVLGLLSGAITVTWSNVISWHPCTLKCMRLLLIEVMSLIVAVFTEVSFKVYIEQNRYINYKLVCRLGEHSK